MKIASVRILMALFVTLATAAGAQSLPERRPALLGSGPESLVNLIDAGELMKNGQEDAWVMFNFTVGVDGRAGQVVLYRVSPGADLLKREVSRNLKRAKFIPAIYMGRLTSAGVFGTAIFVAKNGRPHLRIYENQEMEELKRGSDFIAPQTIRSPYSFYPNRAGYLGLGATVQIRLRVEADGTTTEVKALSSTRPEENFASNAESFIRRSTFLPGYRNGRPVASVITFDFRYFGRSSVE